MQNVNTQLGNGSIIHRCSYYKHTCILVINKVQTYSNVLSIPVKMCLSHNVVSSTPKEEFFIVSVILVVRLKFVVR
jgi:hypothetical protein